MRIPKASRGRYLASEVWTQLADRRTSEIGGSDDCVMLFGLHPADCQSKILRDSIERCCVRLRRSGVTGRTFAKEREDVMSSRDDRCRDAR